MHGVECKERVTPLFAVLLKTVSPPLLKALAFLDCTIAKGFMIQITALHKETALAPVHCATIVNSSSSRLPGVASVVRLKNYVAAAKLVEGRELPTCRKY